MCLNNIFHELIFLPYITVCRTEKEESINFSAVCAIRQRSTAAEEECRTLIRNAGIRDRYVKTASRNATRKRKYERLFNE